MESKNENSSNAGNLIRENQERGSFRSIYEENTADWQDRSTGSMGSQRSGGMTSKKMNAEETSAQDDKHWNRYGQSPDDIQHVKDYEQNIRKGYSETQETDTNPYLRSMYESSTEEQLHGNDESIQQMEKKSEAGSQPQQSSGTQRTAADIYPQGQRVTQAGADEEIGGPMDASKNY